MSYNNNDDEYIRNEEEYIRNPEQDYNNNINHRTPPPRQYRSYTDNTFTSQLMNGETIIWQGERSKQDADNYGKTFKKFSLMPLIFGGIALLAFFTNHALIIFNLPKEAKWISSGFLMTIIPDAIFMLIPLVMFVFISRLIFRNFNFNEKYAITDRRVIINYGGNFISINLSDIIDIQTSTTNNGFGCVTFTTTGDAMRYVHPYASNARYRANRRKGFYNIENPNMVASILDDAVRANNNFWKGELK